MRALIAASVAGVVAGCGLVPWIPRDPPAEECSHLQGAEIIWAGRGDPVALGVMLPQQDVELGSGEIWVTEPVPVVQPGLDADPHELPPTFCYIGPPGPLGQPVIARGSVPEGWEPP